jgi:hypothetical protein
MRQPVTVRLDPAVLRAARDKAGSGNHTLTNYIETLMRKDLRIETSEPALEIVAPEDIRNSVAIPMPGETEAERKRRDDVFHAILDASGR